MKLVKLIILTLCLSTFIGAQSTERFIRIIGNAKKEIQANKAEVHFSISEVRENSYGKIEAKPYDSVYQEVMSKIEGIGIKEKDVKSFFKPGGSYRNTASKSFFVETDIPAAEKLKNLSIQGLIFKKIEYQYEEVNSVLETELSLSAIKDAKRKAKAICDEIDMKLGGILNIEVKESNRPLSAVKEETKMATYNVTITFKLVEE